MTNRKTMLSLWGGVQHFAGLAVLSLLVLANGCIGGFTPPAVIAHPDAPYLIAEVKGKAYGRVFLYDKATNRLIEMGWVDLRQLKGRTAHKYDWEGFIEKHNKPKPTDTDVREVKGMLHAINR